MNFNPNFNQAQSTLQSKTEELNQIDWEEINVEELLKLLDKLGIGHATTIRYLLGKLKGGGKGQVSRLMQFIKILGIGKPGAAKQARTKLQQLKTEGSLSVVLYWSLLVLIARHERKFKEKPNVFESMQLNFTPPYFS